MTTAHPNELEQAYQAGRRALVAGLVRHRDNPYEPFNGPLHRARDRGYLAADANPTAEPGWVHQEHCVCGRCDGRGGYVNPPGPTPHDPGERGGAS